MEHVYLLTGFLWREVRTSNSRLHRGPPPIPTFHINSSTLTTYQQSCSFDSPRMFRCPMCLDHLDQGHFQILDHQPLDLALDTQLPWSRNRIRYPA